MLNNVIRIAAAIGLLAGMGHLSVAAQTPPQFSTAGFFAVPKSFRQVFDFDPGWRFFKGDVAGAEKPSFDDAAWGLANLPHGLEILPENASGGRNYQGPAWYRKRFTAPPGTEGKKTVLYFEAVMGKCKVWINGRQVAEHFGGYLPFAMDVTKLLNPSGFNVVAVRVDNSDDPDFPPGKEQSGLDFTYFGGIYRDVYLIQMGAVHVTLPELSSTVAGGGVFVGVKSVSGSNASLEVRTELTNETQQPWNAVLRTVLENADRKELLRQEKPAALAPGHAVELIQNLEAKNIHLWNLNDPYLHYIRTDVLVNGRVVDSMRTRFGIRLFEMRGTDGFFINGKWVGCKLMGVNRHQDYVYVGNALPKSGHWRDAKLLREGGNNVIRAAHYPQSPAFLDACDALGLLVSDANPGWHFYNEKNPVFAQRMIQDTRDMVRRDRNRPAMLFFETALNETSYQPDSVLKELHAAAHEEYPFPGLFTVADPRHALPCGFDMSFGDVKDGGGKNTFIREYGDGLDNFYSQNSVVRVKREMGEGPLLLSAAARAASLDSMYRRPKQCIGAALWAGIDCQRGYFPIPFYGGLLDPYRVPRYTYYLFKSQYDPGLNVPGIETGPMVYIAHELTPASAEDVVVYSNCEQVHLTWRGKDCGIQSPSPVYKHLPHPPFFFPKAFHAKDIGPWNWKKFALDKGPAEMIAEGLIGGKVVCREVKTYPMRISKVVLSADGQGVPLTADGSDFIPVRAQITDGNGNLKVLESAYVQCQVEGPGEVIGGPENHANPMKTEFGTATFLIRAKTTPGTITVKAFVPGLKPGSLTLTSGAPSLPCVYDPSYARESGALHPGLNSTAAPAAVGHGNAAQLQQTGREQQDEENTNMPK